MTDDSVLVLYNTEQFHRKDPKFANIWELKPSASVNCNKKLFVLKILKHTLHYMNKQDNVTLITFAVYGTW